MIIASTPEGIMPAAAVLCALLLVLVASVSVRAQISPGPLSRAHASLEGMGNCSECHSSAKEQVPDKCMACHKQIAEQQRTSHGLHAQPKYKECVLCHVEHQGVDFDLVHFDGGTEAFDHSTTGFALSGKHAGVACRTCHSPQNIKDERVRTARENSLERTFLGLDTACKSCHFDEHRGQLSDNCVTCHSTAGFKPARGFDHNRAKFALAGKHATVACEKCHVLEADANHPQAPEFRRYVPVAYAQCSDCHKDVHQNRLGPNCDGCHTPADWRQVAEATFDHERTRYPLRGRHSRVACDRCHKTRTVGAKLKFSACLDCHQDYHDGVFAKQAKGSACENCHSVEGFSPSSYRIEQHARTEFPLGGAHLAVPCVACHLVPGGQGKASYRFAWKSTECAACHRDPHGGQTEKQVAKGGCESCHSDAGWKLVKFDHDATGYKLELKHANVECVACHARIDAAKPGLLRFKLGASRCGLCHADVHRGQFVSADPEEGTDCARCHSPAGWKPSKFDHMKDARFALDGAHKRVPCQLCHKASTDPQGTWIQYRPLDTRCVACHQGEIPGQDTKL